MVTHATKPANPARLRGASNFFSNFLIVLWFAGLGWNGFVTTSSLVPAAEGRIELKKNNHQLTVLYDGQVIAEYCFDDPQVSHPYWRQFRTLSGIQLTRNHPPKEGSDATDHVGMHSGAWLAFGDVSGNDYWRLKAKVQQKELIVTPVDETGVSSFRVKNDWLSQNNDAVILKEETQFRFRLVGEGYLLEWDTSLVAASGDVVFGEQEEMGLGLRVATPLAVDKKLGGRMLDSEGRLNGKAIWGQTADWCDYSGPLEGVWGGITLLVDTKNGRQCRCHARDYGFLALNPFSTQVFTGGQPTPFKLDKGQNVRLRFGLYIHQSPNAANFSVLPAKTDFDSKN